MACFQSKYYRNRIKQLDLGDSFKPSFAYLAQLGQSFYELFVKPKVKEVISELYHVKLLVELFSKVLKHQFTTN